MRSVAQGLFVALTALLTLGMLLPLGFADVAPNKGTDVSRAVVSDAAKANANVNAAFNRGASTPAPAPDLSGYRVSPGVVITGADFVGEIWWDASQFQKPWCTSLWGMNCGWAAIDGAYYRVFQNTEIFGYASLYDQKTGNGPDLTSKVGHIVTFYY